MGRRAVIFDDDELIRTTLWRFFDKRGYEVITFSYPDLCPLKVAEQCPCPSGSSCADIIVSDVNMLGRNGIDFIEELVSKGCKHKNFALMSGTFTDADRARGIRLGCALFDKPLNTGAFNAWVEAVEASISTDRILFGWNG